MCCFLAENLEVVYFYLNLALAGVAWMVLQDLDGNDLVGSLFPALCDLAEGAPPRETTN